MDGTLCTVSKCRKITLTTLAALLLVVGVLTERWFLHPRIDPIGQADAIFVLGGGGERVEFALGLTRDGVTTDIVFASEFVGSESVWAARPCNDVRPANVPNDATFRCFEPDPATTRGEARLLRDLADAEGWETVVVVASTDQITRARRLINRCWDGDVRLTGPDHADPFPIRALYEWGAGIKATIRRRC
ncbi:MAG: uncharacterized SAM-binding protein YcdF (DUF218 family) [Candidatus Aldehydirespiratoraceae bacterium]|jgi:uncharacterized SAM-binding protein YcdF (DUF218 family)